MESVKVFIRSLDHKSIITKCTIHDTPIDTSPGPLCHVLQSFNV